MDKTFENYQSRIKKSADQAERFETLKMDISNQTITAEEKIADDQNRLFSTDIENLTVQIKSITTIKDTLEKQTKPLIHRPYTRESGFWPLPYKNTRRFNTIK